MSHRQRRVATRAVAAVLIVAAVWLLFAVVFPWVDRVINDPVLGAAPADLDVSAFDDAAW